MGCLGNVAERPIFDAGASTPRGSDEKRPAGGYDRGDGALVKEDCFIKPDVPLLLPLPDPSVKD